jgi:hypothetical protein
VQLGLENKKQTMWAAILGGVALVACVYVYFSNFSGSSSPAPQAAAPNAASPRTPARTSKIKPGKKNRVENLDPTLRLDLLASAEQTRYEGNGKNIFVAADEAIPIPIASGHTDTKKTSDTQPIYTAPTPPPVQPIPLKFYGFASSPGEPKKIFLKLNDDVFVAGEGEIVDRRYKVIRITNTSVEIQDVVTSGPAQNIPLTQG